MYNIQDHFSEDLIQATKILEARIAEDGLAKTIESIEACAVGLAMTETDSHVTASSEKLGINRTTLIEKIKRFKLKYRLPDKPDFRVKRWFKKPEL